MPDITPNAKKEMKSIPKNPGPSSNRLANWWTRQGDKTKRDRALEQKLDESRKIITAPDDNKPGTTIKEAYANLSPTDLADFDGVRDTIVTCDAITDAAFDQLNDYLENGGIPLRDMSTGEPLMVNGEPAKHQLSQQELSHHIYMIRHQANIRLRMAFAQEMKAQQTFKQKKIDPMINNMYSVVKANQKAIEKLNDDLKKELPEAERAKKTQEIKDLKAAGIEVQKQTNIAYGAFLEMQKTTGSRYQEAMDNTQKKLRELQLQTIKQFTNSSSYTNNFWKSQSLDTLRKAFGSEHQDAVNDMSHDEIIQEMDAVDSSIGQPNINNLDSFGLEIGANPPGTISVKKEAGTFSFSFPRREYGDKGRRLPNFMQHLEKAQAQLFQQIAKDGYDGQVVIRANEKWLRDAMIKAALKAGIPSEDIIAVDKKYNQAYGGEKVIPHEQIEHLEKEIQREMSKDTVIRTSRLDIADTTADKLAPLADEQEEEHDLDHDNDDVRLDEGPAAGFSSHKM